MANSIKEYDTIPVTEYEYTTPDYLEGRESDIRVYLDDQETTNFTLNGTALRLIPAPSAGQRLRIERVSDASSRLVDYTDGSLLTAETLDKDADHIFYVAQEAYDQSRVTNTASGKFYYSQTEAPTNPEAGTLWYNKSLTPNVLQIWDGTEWHAAAPVKNTYVYDTNHVDYHIFDSAYDNINVTFSQINNSTVVLLNGVRLRPATGLGTLGTEGDYYLQVVAADVIKVWFLSLASDDVVTIETHSGGYANSIDQLVNQFNIDNAAITAMINDVDPKLDQVIAYDIPQVLIDVEADKQAADAYAQEAALFADASHNTPFTASGSGTQRFSAKHYSTEAADSAEQAARTAAGINDPIEGWAEVDNETITTVSSNDPIIYSNGDITIKADNDLNLEATDVNITGTLQVAGGITLSNFNAPTLQGALNTHNGNWQGSSGVTVETTNTTDLWKLTSTAFDGTGDDYSVKVSIVSNNAVNNIPVVKVQKHDGHIFVRAYGLDYTTGAPASITNCEVFIESYNF